MLLRSILKDQLKVIDSVAFRDNLRLQNWIDDNLGHIFDHPWHKSFHVLVRSSQEWIVIHLDQPHTKIFIKEKIESEKLEAVLTVVCIHFFLDAKERIDYDILYTR
mgnify:CR=1 FL=1